MYSETDISHIIESHGTSYPEWNHLLTTLKEVLMKEQNLETRIELSGLIIHTLRAHHLNDSKQYIHLDSIVSMLVQCLKLSDIEKAIQEYEDEEQWQLAPIKYEKFTGDIIVKLLDLVV